MEHQIPTCFASTCRRMPTHDCSFIVDKTEHLICFDSDPSGMNYVVEVTDVFLRDGLHSECFCQFFYQNVWTRNIYQILTKVGRHYI